MLLLVSAALAQSVTAVPPGARAVTVMTCVQPVGCPEAWQAMGDHAAGQGVPVLDFDAVAAAGPGGGDARAALDAALARVEESGDRQALDHAREVMMATPLTLPADVPFRLWLKIAEARLHVADTEGADAAFAAAGSSTGGRSWNLPPLAKDALDRYLSRSWPTTATARLSITADVPLADVFVDGTLVGRAPIEVQVMPGWHRVTVERASRRTAWVGEITAAANRTTSLQAAVAADDAPAAMEASVLAAIRGGTVAPEVGEQLAAWGRGQGLAEIRFVSVERIAPAHRPEERFTFDGKEWDVLALWLDCGSGRFREHGGGPASLRTTADPDRITAGVTVGYTRVDHTQPTGPDPHDHLATELFLAARVSRHVAIDARLGLWNAAQPWYLYDDWLGTAVVPVAAGLRWMPGKGEGYVGLHGLAVVPFALGGEAFAGWAWRPSPRWRLGIEGRGGYTDEGPVYGGSALLGWSG